MAKFAYETGFPVAPALIYPILTDPDFLEDYAREVGAMDWRVRVDPGDETIATDVVLVAPTQHIPALFRRFVGQSVDVSELRAWRPESDGNFRADWTVHAVLGGRDSYLRGRLRLAEAEAGTRFDASAQVEVRLGPLSGMAAGRVGDLVSAALNHQAEVVRRWLAATSAG